MVVVALIGVIGTLAFSSLQGMRRRVDVHGFLSDFTAALSNAQSRSLASGGDTWVIVYETTGTASTIKHGAFYIYDDPDGDFDFAAFAVDPDTGNPTASPETGDRLLDQVLLRKAPYDARIKMVMGGASFPLNSPFAGPASACNFCSTGADGNRRGAIVFQGDGRVRFLQADGTPAPAVSTTGILTLASSSAQNGHDRGAVAISSVSGFMRVTKR